MDIWTPDKVTALRRSGYEARAENYFLAGDRINCPSCGSGTVDDSGLLELDIPFCHDDGGSSIRYCNHYAKFVAGSDWG